MPYEGHAVQTAVLQSAARIDNGIPASLEVLPFVAFRRSGEQPCGIGGSYVVIVFCVLVYEALPLTEGYARLTTAGGFDTVIEVYTIGVPETVRDSPCAPLAVSGRLCRSGDGRLC